ncbi:XdhC family protein [Shewanella surugensis]|uniref:XdhC family protein n=1 Tax=Shewanella surugensis TaxID=212020 RepID=A0ABT0LDD7_9GAMM|nr:XdhC family protein [Shewanella surugensis]MCL1125726.1 XdhC family protein [Shewanella surugensis]
MQLTDITVLKTTLDWLYQGQSVWLCTILNTYGSAPRPVGALFVTDGTHRRGSISGGCLEDAFIEMLNEGHFKTAVSVFSYGDHMKGEAIATELPCGGSIRLLVERLRPDDTVLAHFDKWLSLAQSSSGYRRQIERESGHSQVVLTPNLYPLSVSETNDVIVVNYEQVWKVVLLGISQVSMSLAQLAIMAGYEVHVCDMRKQFESSWTYTAEMGGVDVTWISPDRLVDKVADSCTAVLALAHDPRIDDLGLMSAFESDAFYLGAMGSKRTSVAREERLQRICELSVTDLTRLHAPIGLNIGSKTPIEIAISIMADIIRVKNNIPLEQL